MDSTGSIELRFEAPGPGVWSWDGSHLRHPATRVHQELFPPAMAEGMRSCFARYGLPLSHFDTDYVHGWIYQAPRPFGAPEKAGAPPPVTVMKVLVRLVPAMRARWRTAAAAEREQRWLTDAAAWESERDWWIEQNLALQDIDPESSSDAELAGHLEAAAAHAAHGLRRHFELLGPAVGVGRFLVAGRAWGLTEREVFSVLEGCSPASGMAPTLVAIAASLRATGVRPSSLDDVRLASPDAANALEAHLRMHGWWSSSDDVDGAPLAGAPATVLASIHAAMARTEPAAGAGDPAAHVVATLRARVPDAARAEFDSLLAEARRCYATLDDNSGLTASWPFGLLGRACRAAAVRLVAAGILASPDDVWCLGGEELTALLRGTGGPDAEEIARRATHRARAADLSPPAVLGGEASAPPPADVFPGAAGRLTAAIGAFIEAKFGRAEVCTVGDVVHRGRAVVALDAADALDRLEPGDVLVTTCTTPAFNAILPVAGAVVTTTGGPLCHTAVVARELGLPAVIGLADVMDHVADGVQVEVDPRRGTVRVV